MDYYNINNPEEKLGEIHYYANDGQDIACDVMANLGYVPEYDEYGEEVMSREDFEWWTKFFENYEG